MATTTTNFGWDIPQSTDLVKDGATAIATLGQDIDTSMMDLKGGTTGQVLKKASNTDMDFTWSSETGDIEGVSVTSPLTGGGTSGTVTVGIQDGTTLQKGAVQLTDSTASTSTTTAATPNSVKSAYDLANGAIPKSTVTTNGDLIYGTGSGTLTRLGIGSTGQALLVSGGVPSWGTVSAGSNWSLLGSVALTGAATLSVSGISGKNKLMVVFVGASCASASVSIGIRINGSSSSQYYYAGQQFLAASTWNTQNLNSTNAWPDSLIPLAIMSSSATSVVNGYAMIDGCNTSGVKTFTWAAGATPAGGNSAYNYTGGGIWDNSSTVTSIQAYNGGGVNFDAGTMYVYSSVN